MKSNGTWTEDKRRRMKFRCAIKTSSTVARQYSDGCPIKKACFLEGKAYGCTKYLYITNDARANIPRDTEFFKETYKLRTEIERYFGRLGNREFEQTTHYNI